ncbi:hypothetical protein ACFQ5Q_05895 [Luteolibacter ambystomatis]|uniref:hypothetical protein n=1 Tax=Luteolibacter ambystomatis TaxID=2824561 RepID=UPI00363D5AF9
MTHDERTFRALEIAAHVTGQRMPTPYIPDSPPLDQIHPEKGRALTPKEYEEMGKGNPEFEWKARAFELHLVWAAATILRCADSLLSDQKRGEAA